MTDEVRKDIESKGMRVIASSHALSGVERSVVKKNFDIYPVLLIADTLRLLVQGTKVAVEVTVMAADAGTLTGADIISIGGSSICAAAALFLEPAHRNIFLV